MDEAQLMWVGAWILVLLAILFWWGIIRMGRERDRAEAEEEEALDHYGEAPGHEDPEKAV